MANKHGDFIWYELMSPDADGAQAFYGPLLGWSFHPGPGERDYRVIAMGEAGVGGILPWPAGGAMPSAWLGYIGVDDVDAMVKSVEAAGGSVLMAPWEIAGVGRMALLADPQGAAFYVCATNPIGTSLPFPTTGRALAIVPGMNFRAAIPQPPSASTESTSAG